MVKTKKYIKITKRKQRKQTGGGWFGFGSKKILEKTEDGILTAKLKGGIVTYEQKAANGAKTITKLKLANPKMKLNKSTLLDYQKATAAMKNKKGSQILDKVFHADKTIGTVIKSDVRTAAGDIIKEKAKLGQNGLIKKIKLKTMINGIEEKTKSTFKKGMITKQLVTRTNTAGTKSVAQKFFNTKGRVAKIREGSGIGGLTHNFKYDRVGKIQSIKSGNRFAFLSPKNTTKFTYDKGGRTQVTKRSGLFGRKLDYTKDLGVTTKQDFAKLSDGALKGDSYFIKNALVADPRTRMGTKFSGTMTSVPNPMYAKAGTTQIPHTPIDGTVVNPMFKINKINNTSKGLYVNLKNNASQLAQQEKALAEKAAKNAELKAAQAAKNAELKTAQAAKNAEQKAAQAAKNAELKAAKNAEAKSLTYAETSINNPYGSTGNYANTNIARGSVPLYGNTETVITNPSYGVAVPDKSAALNATEYSHLPGTPATVHSTGYTPLNDLPRTNPVKLNTKNTSQYLELV